MEPMNNEVSLRDVRQADLPVLFEQQLDPEATRMAAFPSRRYDAFMAHWAKCMADDTNVLKAIILDGRVAGSIVSWVQSGRRHVGYWLGREYWGRGIATAALARFLACVKARPLYAHVATANTASIRVLQKCGFTIAQDDAPGGAEAGAVSEFLMKLDANHLGENEPA